MSYIYTPIKSRILTTSLIDHFCIDTNNTSLDNTDHFPFYLNIHLHLDIIKNNIYIYIY